MEGEIKTFTIDCDDHEIGNTECSECWPWYPKKCECGGLVHASFGDENWDGYWLIYRCDKCGDDYEEIE